LPSFVAVLTEKNAKLLHVWQEAYALLTKYEIQITKEETDMVDTMRYKFKNIIGQSVTSLTVDFASLNSFFTLL